MKVTITVEVGGKTGELLDGSHMHNEELTGVDELAWASIDALSTIQHMIAEGLDFDNDVVRGDIKSETLSIKITN